MDYTLPVWFLDLVIAFFLLEWGCLYFYFKHHPKGLTPWDMSFALAPGFFLVLGFRFNAQESISAISLACLFLAGVVHAIDLFWRHQKAKSKESLDASKGSI
jgi:uncharacterized membrane protein HdeD (DUF308 family)